LQRVAARCSISTLAESRVPERRIASRESIPNFGQVLLGRTPRLHGALLALVGGHNSCTDHLCSDDSCSEGCYVPCKFGSLVCWSWLARGCRPSHKHWHYRNIALTLSNTCHQKHLVGPNRWLELKIWVSKTLAKNGTHTTKMGLWIGGSLYRTGT